MPVQHNAENRAAIIAELALRSMLYEVSCSPSPGLVSPFDSGAHSDMDFFTFMRSVPSLFHSIERCALEGFAARSLDGLFPRLRSIGVEGERRMLKATGGVNTQKGQIFIHGTMAVAVGHLLKQGIAPTVDRTCEAVAELCEGLVARDFAGLENKPVLTRGERLYLSHGIAGIRAEVELGLPSIIECGIPALREARRAGLSENGVAASVLLTLMSRCDDSNVAGKHSVETLAEMKTRARKILDAGGLRTPEGRDGFIELHKDFSRRKISPGGAADLTAATFFAFFVEEEFCAGAELKDGND